MMPILIAECSGGNRRQTLQRTAMGPDIVSRQTLQGRCLSATRAIQRLTSKGHAMSAGVDGTLVTRRQGREYTRS
jgi:hypothetical protein